MPKPKVEILNPDEYRVDPTNLTVILHEEDHTIGNSLKHILCGMKDVEFCGYNIPHPLEDKILIRIQTTKGIPAAPLLLEGLLNLAQMAGEMLSVHVGQCGNQLGQSFWKKMCEEHGIDGNGHMICPEKPAEDYKEAFFYQADDSHYIPRAVLVDLEPRVIHGMMADPDLGNLFNEDNLFISSEGGGAGNNWADGYAQGNKIFTEILDKIEREAENCDRMDGFQFTHSVSGGTGSGLGSIILEKLRDRYPKKLIETYSVFANPQGGDASSDVVVAPYNSVLTLERLIDFADDVVVLDNASLYRLAAGKFKTQKPTFEHINSLVTRIMSTSTSMIRFCSPLIPSLAALNLTPYPPMRFIQAGFSPVVDPNQAFNKKTTVTDVIRFLLKPTSMMVSTANSSNKDHCMLGGVLLLQGTFDHSDLQNVYLDSESSYNSVQRAKWDIMNPLSILESPSSPYIKSQYKVSGLLLNNNTSIRPLLAQILKQYQTFRKRNAYVNKFESQEGFSLSMMDASAERVQEVIEMYQEAEKETFFS